MSAQLWSSDVRHADVNIDALKPHELLGVPEGTTQRSTVLDALRARLDQVASPAWDDPERVTPWRVALHAAAMRLLTSSTPTDAPTEGLATKPPADTRWQELGWLVMSTHGGCTPRAIQQFQMIALAQGASTAQVDATVAAMLDAQQSGADAWPGQAVDAQAAAIPIERAWPAASQPEDGWTALPARPRERSPLAAMLPWVLLVGAVGAGVVVIAVGLRIAFSPSASAPPGPVAAPPVSSAPQVPARAEQPKPAQPSAVADAAQASRVEAPADLLRDVRAFDERNTDTHSPALRATERFASVWPRASRAERLAALDAIVEVAYGVGISPQLRSPLVEALAPLPASPPSPAGTLDDPIRQAWQLTVARRLLLERDLDATLRAEVAQRWGLASGASAVGSPGAARAFFAGGADDALLQAVIASTEASIREVPPLQPRGDDTAQLAQAREAWSRWLGAFDVLADGSARRQPALLRLSDALLARAGQAARGGSDVLAAAGFGVLLPALDWKPDQPARRRLLLWLDDASNPTPVLASVSSIVVQQGDAGLDPSFVLPLVATIDARAELRGRLARFWQLGDVGDVRVQAEQWLTLASAALGADDATAPAPEEAVHQAMRLAALHAAAALLWEGRTQDAAPWLAQADIVPPAAPTVVAQGAPINSWAEEYLRAGNDVPRRRQIITSRATQAAPSGAEARILLDAFGRGGNAELRAAALTALTIHARSPEVLRALTETLPLLPPTRDLAALVREATGQTIPAPRSASFRVQARRALLLASLRDAPSRRSMMETSSLAIGTAYEAMAQAGASASEASSNDPLEQAQRVRQRLLAALQVEEARLPAGQQLALAQLLSRRSQPRGPLTAFVSVQSDVLRLRQLQFHADQSPLAERADQVIERWERAFLSASSAQQQLWLSEHAMVQLWRLRLSAGGTP